MNWTSQWPLFQFEIYRLIKYMVKILKPPKIEI